jgi:hypothetical protein
VKAWKSAYNAATGNQNEDMMEQFWSIYDPNVTSIWTMVYDEADSNENLEQTIEYVTTFLKQTESIQDHCFCVVHTLEGLEIEGVWLFNGPDPEKLFGANEDSSWFTFSQLGPAATDIVKNAVSKIMAPTDQTLNGKAIKDTQVLC